MLALANKESLVAGGSLVTGRGRARADRAGRFRAQRAGAVPARRCTAARSPGWSSPRPVARSVAGPRRRWPRSPPREALAHPTWAMGPVVTINSATLVNKGLEVIEAHLLFDIPYDRIDVVVHPQSVIHSMVTFVDGSTLAQASPPDMKLPIALALAWPHRLDRVAAACDFAAPPAGPSSRSTERLSPRSTWPSRRELAGGTVPAAFNAANEEAVDGLPSTATCVSQVSPTFCGAFLTRPISAGATRGMCRTSGPRKTGPDHGPGNHPGGGHDGRLRTGSLGNGHLGTAASGAGRADNSRVGAAR